MKVINKCIISMITLSFSLCSAPIPAKGTKLNVIEGALRNKLTQNTATMNAQQYLRWNKNITEYLASLPQNLKKDYSYRFMLKRAALSETTINELYRYWSGQIAQVLYQLQSRLVALHTKYRNAQPSSFGSFYKETSDTLKSLITPLIADLEASIHFVGNKAALLPEYQNFALALINLFMALDLNAINRYIQYKYGSHLGSMPQAQAHAIATQGFNTYYDTAYKLYNDLLVMYGRNTIEDLFNRYQRSLPSTQSSQQLSTALPSEQPSIPTQQPSEHTTISSAPSETIQFPPSAPQTITQEEPTPPQSITAYIVPDSAIQPFKDELNALIGANRALLEQDIPQQEGLSWQELFADLLDNTNTQQSQGIFTDEEMVEFLMDDITYAFLNPTSLLYEQLAHLAARALMAIAQYYQDEYDPLFLTRLREKFNEPLKKGIQQGRINPRYSKI